MNRIVFRTLRSPTARRDETATIIRCYVNRTSTVSAFIAAIILEFMHTDEHE